MRFTSGKIQAMREYAESLNGELQFLSSGSRLSTKGIPLIWAISIIGFAIIGGLPTTVNEFFADHIPTITYFLFILSYFVWTYGVSMLTLYRMGDLPLKLKPFVEDKTLGLRPFGVASLQLTGLYIVLPIAIALTTAFSAPNLIDLIFITTLTLTGLIFFFLPLQSFHRKLSQAKHDELEWINSQYARMIHQLKNGPHGTPTVAGTQMVANELLMVRYVQQDIRQIEEWPIDITILTRLITVLALPPILGVAARILILTILHI
jgi:hypothetical protein